MTLHIDRRAYAEMFGPTTGDRVRLGDTDLIIEVERDHTVYGEEVKFGGGKVIRDGMGQGQRVSAETVDTVITLRTLGMMGLWNTGKGENERMVAEKAEAFTQAAVASARAMARGQRLDIAAGTAVRFEPGQSREVTLVPLVGKRVVIGFRGDVMGKL